MRILKQYLDRWFVPAELDQDPATQRQARRAVVCGLAMLFWAPVFAPIYWWLGSPRGCVMIGLVGVAILASLTSLRFTKSAFLTGHLIAGSVFAVLIGLAMVTGGTGAPSLWWFEATQTIRDQEREAGGRIPIVAMTAHALKGDRERCLEAGMDEYVSKPIHAKRLLEIIETVLKD
jgi:hypothetical protein